MTSFEHEQLGMTETTEERLMRVAAENVDKVRTCHERVACPRCTAPVGERCCEMPKGWKKFGLRGRALLHAHKERWTQEVPER